MKKKLFTVLALVLVFVMAISFVACKDKEIDKVTVTYDANGGTGTMPASEFEKGAVSSLVENAFTNGNATFAGWAEEKNGAIRYADKGVFVAEQDVTLYAVWNRDSLTANVSAMQKAVDDKSLNVKLSNVSEKLGKAEIGAYYRNRLIAGKTITNAEELAKNEFALDGLFGGRFVVKAKLYSEDLKETYETAVDANVCVSEANFAFMAATFPVSLFTLMMCDADTTYFDSTAETYVWLARNKAYNWDALLPNMKRIPVITDEPWDKAIDALAFWAKELYEINPEVSLTGYFTDLFLSVPSRIFIETSIPTENWKAYLFSDGSGTAGELKATYNVADPQAKHDQLVASWHQYLKDHKRTALADYHWSLKNYMYVAYTEMPGNFVWYAGRLRANENLILEDADFANKIINDTKALGRKECYLNSLLAALSEEEKAAFKALYHIDDETFAAADEAGKKKMMILGTSWGGENGNLEDYMRITMEVYGKDYTYYYKGHPGYPTSQYPERQKILDKLVAEGYDLHELDNSVAAEFFLFFFDDLEMIGYQSSTFASGTDKNADGVYGFGIDDGYQYSELLETFINKIGDVAAINEKYAGLNLADGNYYLIETKGIMATEYSVAVYNIDTKKIEYFALKDGAYVKIAK